LPCPRMVRVASVVGIAMTTTCTIMAWHHWTWVWDSNTGISSTWVGDTDTGHHWVQLVTYVSRKTPQQKWWRRARKWGSRGREQVSNEWRKSGRRRRRRRKGGKNEE